MNKQIHHARPALEQAFAFAQAVRVGNMLYISGALSWDENGEPVAVGDMEGQVRNVYADLEKVLKAHGATFSNVVKETVYTVDMDALVAAAHIRAEFLKGHSPFAATWVQVARLVKPEFLIEVEMIAALPGA